MKFKTIFAIILTLAINFANMAQNIQPKKNVNYAWLDSLIAKGYYGKSPISDIKSYSYQNKIVYLVNFNVACCDQFSAVLMDENGKTICHPFGGISGKGDMKCTDFLKEKSEEKVIWVNENPVKESEKKERSFKMEKSGN